MTKTIKGKDQNGEVVETEVESIFTPSNAKAMKKVFKEVLVTSAKTEEQKRLDIAKVAGVAAPAISAYIDDLGKVPSPSMVQNMVYLAGGITVMKTSEPGYKTFMRRINAGIQSALTAELSEAHRLAPEDVKDDDGKVVVFANELQAHENQLIETFVLRDSDGGVIDAKCPNTPERNATALDWTRVPGSGSIAKQAEKVGAKERANRGTKEATSKDALADQGSGGYETFLALRDLITGKSTGRQANIANLNKAEKQVVLAAIEIAKVAHTQALAAEYDNAADFVMAELKDAA